MSTDFIPGDIVVLKSGGLAMTVRYYVDTQAAKDTGKQIGVHCDWMSSDGWPQSAAFHSEMLQLKESEASE